MRMEFPFLSLMIVVPLVGCVISFLLPRESTKAKWICLTAALINLFLSFLALFSFLWSWPVPLPYDKTGSFAAYERTSWVPELGMSYILGVDGLSLPLIVLTHLLVALGIVFSWKESERPKEFFALLLLMDLSISGVFMALDLFLFFVFWELVLVPMYFLISIWGGPNKHYAAIKFLIYTHVGSVVMLLGIFALYFMASPVLVGGERTFDLAALAEQVRVNPQYLGSAFQFPAFIAFFFGFGVKMPMVPFHTWLPDAHVEAPTAGSVILAGLLLKMGGYGLFRVGMTLFPMAMKELWWVVASFGILSMIYAAFVCLAQTDLKRLIAYSSVSHMGFVLLGASSLVTIGIAGGIFQMFNHGLITAVLFMLAGVTKRSCHTREIPKLTGLITRMPRFSFVLIVSFFASLGLPGLNGFVSEFMVFAGAYGTFGRYLMIPLLAVVVTGAYYIWTLHRVLFGKFNEALGKVRDLTGEELLPLAILIFFLVFFGLYPTPVVWLIEPFAADLAGFLGGVG